MLVEPVQRPEVQTYLAKIRSDPGFEQLFLTDLNEFVALERDPGGWDWADHDGSRVVDSYWLEASEPNEQMRLAQICHLRALAWEAAVMHIRRAS